jgi:hypothetical protein
MTETTVGYTAIISKLNECSQLRNKVAHANWESMDEQGYTFVKLNISKNGLKQEYLQFTRESLEKIVDLINTTRVDLYNFGEERNQLLFDT